MLILITYDVNTETADGRRRLRKVAKVCQDYGQRVQNSVFECEMDAALLLKVKDRLLRLVDLQMDSLRFYMLGNDRNRVEHFGAKPSYDVTGPLIV